MSMNLGSEEVKSDKLFLTVNWHLVPHCNYKCRFCYQTFPDKKEWNVDLDSCKRIIKTIKDSGIYKITFSGGEPLLHPHILKLILFAKELGLTTSVVTNGTKLNHRFMEQVQGSLDIIAISVDSALENTEKILGRGNGGHVAMVLEVSALIHKFSVRLKLNTVVTKLNYREDMRDFIKKVHPERWKIFQFLPILGENDLEINNLSISKEQFNEFVERNSIDIAIPIFPEDNNSMTSSYIMIDPFGYIMQNHFGKYIRGISLFDVPLKDAVINIGFNLEKYLNRGGSYE